jgi:G:T-mismatch repair DNA endonuclease (very short patch repair protein)
MAGLLGLPRGPLGDDVDVSEYGGTYSLLNEDWNATTEFLSWRHHAEFVNHAMPVFDDRFRFRSQIILPEAGWRLTMPGSTDWIVGVHEIPHLENSLAHVFNKIFLYVKHQRMLHDGDLMSARVVKLTEGGEMSTGLLDISKMNADYLGWLIMQIITSRESIDFDNMELQVKSVKDIRGAGYTYATLGTLLKKKQCIVQIKNKDTLCFARCVALFQAWKSGNKKEYKMMMRQAGAMTKEAQRLQIAAGLEIYNPVGLTNIPTFERLLGLSISVVDADSFMNLIYAGDGLVTAEDRMMYLLLKDGHFSLIKSMTGLLARNYYCNNCHKTYGCERRHRCSITCIVCHSKSCPEGEAKTCEDCKRPCVSAECFASHKRAPGGKPGGSICATSFFCLDCNHCFKYRYSNHDDYQSVHICGEAVCVNCDAITILKTHECYVKVLEDRQMKKKSSPDNLYLYFDFECTQHVGVHEVNAVCAAFDSGSGVQTAEFDSLDAFCSWLVTGAFKGYTCIAHNGRGYDFHFVLRWLVENCLDAPEVIYAGGKLLSMRVKTLNLKFVDSLSFLTMPLSAFPKAFGFEELKKGYFPHLFNRPENYTYVGPLPPIETYCADSMKPKARLAFEAWHAEHKEDIFDFRKELYAYCHSDVDILRRCCDQFRADFVSSCSVDPFQYVTIASACMATYRYRFMPEGTIACVSPQTLTAQSGKAIEWLEWMQYTHPEQDIQTVLDKSGEKAFGKYRVDGYDMIGESVVYEFYGCFWHGCPTCYTNPKMLNTLAGKTMGRLFSDTERREAFLREKGLRIVAVWEHEWDYQRTRDVEKEYLETHISLFEPMLCPKDAFFGGRTNATKLLYTFGEGEVGRYFDITSLYPSVNYYDEYPCGHHIIITEFEEDGLNPVVNARLVHEYFGVVKCDVTPTRRLYHPVLPHRDAESGKLFFDLTAKKGTWCTVELVKAVECGYRIDKIYEVHHFAKRTTSMFKEYVKTYLKLKQEASGWPEWCVDDATKSEYLLKYKEHMDIDLNPESIASNPGMRQVAKLMLNSLWGKFAQRPNLTKTKLMCDKADFFEVLCNESYDFKDFDIVNDRYVQMHYKYKTDHVMNDFKTNMYVALFTTSHARIRLYAALELLDRQVLYYDTDSVIYQSKPSDPSNKELIVGDYLGDWTDELDGDVIVGTFCSTGPKSYSYETATDVTCKIKGFVLNDRNSRVLNHSSMKHLLHTQLIAGESLKYSVTNPSMICRDKRRKVVYNRIETKTFRLTYDKRAIQTEEAGNIDTLPFGWEALSS